MHKNLLLNAVFLAMMATPILFGTRTIGLKLATAAFLASVAVADEKKEFARTRSIGKPAASSAAAGSAESEQHKEPAAAPPKKAKIGEGEGGGGGGAGGEARPPASEGDFHRHRPPLCPRILPHRDALTEDAGGRHGQRHEKVLCRYSRCGPAAADSCAPCGSASRARVERPHEPAGLGGGGCVHVDAQEAG